ncbi:MAG: DUF805 domain-containing protein [Limnohabitans sp.]|nr:DUF805 domain-containing protein [Limnohabitans sp.]
MGKSEENYNAIDWWKKVVFENYANFNGRARRKEYWNFQLINIVSILIIVVIGISLSGNSDDVPLVFYLFGIIFLGIIIPSIAVTVRRLHDIGKSGWFYLISFVPYVGGLIMLYFTVLDSEQGSNQYGSNPKEFGNDDEINEIGVTQE